MSVWREERRRCFAMIPIFCSGSLKLKWILQIRMSSSTTIFMWTSCPKSKDSGSVVVAFPLLVLGIALWDRKTPLYLLLCGAWHCVCTMSAITASLFTGESPSDLWQSSCYCIGEDELRLPCFSDPEGRKTGIVLHTWRWQKALA